MVVTIPTVLVTLWVIAGRVLVVVTFTVAVLVTAAGVAVLITVWVIAGKVFVVVTFTVAVLVIAAGVAVLTIVEVCVRLTVFTTLVVSVIVAVIDCC